MHTVKSLQSNSHDPKTAPESNIKDKTSDLFGLALDSAKCSSPKRKPLYLKSPKKNDHSFVGKSASAQLKLLSKRAEKRQRVTNALKGAKLSTPIGKLADNFICKYCCRSFRSREQLHAHVIHHGSNPSYVCYVCGLEAQAFSSLMSHCVKHSREKNSSRQQKKQALDEEVFPQSDSAIRCSLCKVTFPSTDKLASHYCSKTKKSEYNCAYCGHSSFSLNDYRLHVMSHSTNTMNSYHCLHCNFRGLTKMMLDKHYEVCKKRPKSPEKTVFRCKSCKLEFKHRKLLNRHFKSCKQESQTKDDCKSCTKCNTQFGSDADYDEHVLVCESNESEHSMSLQNCEPLKKPKLSPSKIAKSKSDLVLCTRCGDFLDKRGYVRHRQACLKKNSSINENAVDLCPTCGDIFQKDVLEEHSKSCNQSIPTEESDNEFRLGEDGDSPTRRSSRLGRPKGSSSDENSKGKKMGKKKRFKSNSVKKVLVMKGRQSKLGKDTFKCTDCDLTFCSKSTLLRHKRMHSGNPYFSCKFCGKFFFRKDVYTRHEVNVHSKTSKTIFCCYYCKMYFAGSRSLRVHVFATHKSNAFLPIKPDISEKSDQENPGVVTEIKKEPNCDSNEDMLNSSKKPKVKNSFKADNPASVVMKQCGTCLQTFLLEAEIEEHLMSHIEEEPPASPEPEPEPMPAKTKVKGAHASVFKRVIEPEAQTQDPITPKLKKRRGRSVTPKSAKASPAQSKKTLPVNSSQSLNEPSSVNSTSHDRNFNANMVEVNHSDAIVNDFGLNPMDIIAAFKEKSDVNGFTCKLCSNMFKSKTLLKAHEETKHKMLDWYKCLVCDTFGPKLEMIEHMFSHMFKVGTFVTNGDHNSLDSLMSCLLNQDMKQCSSESTAIQNQATENFESGSISDGEMEFELPQLVDHGSTDCLPQSDNELVSSPRKGSNMPIDAESNNYQDGKADDSCNASEDESPSQTQQHTVSKGAEDSNLCSTVAENSKSEQDSHKEISNDGFSNKDKQERPQILDDQSSENSKFSHLRYLLENFKKGSPDSKESDKANAEDKESSKFAQLRHLLKSIPLNSLRTIKDNLNQINSSQNLKQTSNEAKESYRNMENNSSTSCDFNAEAFPTMESTPSSRLASHVDKFRTQDVSPQTCFRSDVNQSRGEVTEAPHSLKPDTSRLSGVQRKILDFSDMLLGDSSNTYDGFRKEEILNFPPRDQSATTKLNQFSCAQDTSSQFREGNKATNHSKDFSPNSSCAVSESRSTVPRSYGTTDPRETDFLPKTLKSRQLPKFFNSNYMCSVCDKPLRNSDELKLHYQNEHSSRTLPNNVCKSCYQTFSNSIECAKHFTSCTKLHFRKNQYVDSNPKLPVTLQTLLAEDPSRPQSYSPASPDYEPSIPDVFKTSALNIPHNPFNS